MNKEGMVLKYSRRIGESYSHRQSAEIRDTIALLMHSYYYDTTLFIHHGDLCRSNHWRYCGWP